MGNHFSNVKEFTNDPSLVVCDAKKLQKRLLKHSNNAKIIKIVERTPYASNYMYDPITRIAEQESFFENFYSCRNSLYFQIGTLRFCPGCKIVLTKQHYAEILELEKSKEVVPLSKDDEIKILRWTCGYNFFVQ